MTVSIADDTKAPTSNVRRIVGATLAVLMCNAVGVTGALFTSTDTAWYVGLTKPSFQPPGWIFGPMWTLLYTLMGIAVFRVFEKRREDGGRVALGLFAVQLALNGIWSPIFFGAEAIGLALVVIGMMVVAIGITMRHFFTVDRLAGWLLLPYLAWVSFATILNGTLVALN